MKRDHCWLKKRLVERSSHPDRSLEIDRDIWEKCGQNCAVLVSDSSGFTRITKRQGILSFLAMVENGVTLSRPIIERQRGELLKQEADNMLCTFPSVDHAVRSAVAIIHALRSYNARVENGDLHTKFCFGIGYGRVLRLTDEIFGDEVNVAYKLGEDTAGPEDILLSEEAVEALSGPIEGVSLGEPESVRVSNVDLAFCKAQIL